MCRASGLSVEKAVLKVQRLEQFESLVSLSDPPKDETRRIPVVPLEGRPSSVLFLCVCVCVFFFFGGGGVLASTLNPKKSLNRKP